MCIWISWMLFLVVSLLKYVLCSSLIDPKFLNYDLVAFLFLILSAFLFYRHSRLYIQLQKSHSDELKIVQANFDAERSELLTRIQNIEQAALDAEKNSILAKRLVGDINKIQHKLNLESRSIKLFSLLSSNFEITTGILYRRDSAMDHFKKIGSYAIDSEFVVPPIETGIGLGGQAVADGKTRVIYDVPTDYLIVSSGLGESKSCYLYLLPVSCNNKVIALFEIASFKKLNIDLIWGEINDEIGNVLAKD